MEHLDDGPYNCKDVTDGDDDNNEDFACPSMPVLLDQQNLSDLIRNLILSKEFSEVLTIQLKDWNLLQHGTKVTLHKTQDKEFVVPLFNGQYNFVFYFWCTWWN